MDHLTLTKTFHRHLYDIKHKQLSNVLFQPAENITLFPTGEVAHVCNTYSYLLKH
jgi:hypothetical protein